MTKPEAKTKCENCKFWKQNPDNPGTKGSGTSPNAMGKCRKTLPERQEATNRGEWPETAWRECCGEFNQKFPVTEPEAKTMFYQEKTDANTCPECGDMLMLPYYPNGFDNVGIIQCCKCDFSKQTKMVPWDESPTEQEKHEPKESTKDS